jgi:hypothetical protein
MKKSRQKTAALLLLAALLLTLAPAGMAAAGPSAGDIAPGWEDFGVKEETEFGAGAAAIASELEAMAADLQAMAAVDLTPRYGPNGKFLAPIDAPDPSAIPISNRAELEKIGIDPNYPLSGSYALTADIDLSGLEWTPIGPGTAHTDAFSGTFDGQGHVISGLTITSDAYLDNGLFGYVNEGTVKNVGLEDTDIDVSRAGRGISAGGICGSASGAISACYNTGDISASSDSSSSHAGGICGYNDGSDSTVISISNCYNTGDISSVSSPPRGVPQANAGGISGVNFGIISDCYNTGTITSFSSESTSGGISGVNSGIISDCYNMGRIIDSVHGGGIVGLAPSDDTVISNCYNMGSVIDSNYGGGIIGRNDGNNLLISNCYNTGDVTATIISGGICGWFFDWVYNSPTPTGSISDCYNAGAIRGSSYDSVAALFVGGICGHASASISISDCYNTGSVSSFSSVSDNGRNNGSISYAGGICGETSASASISNCYNAGAVSSASTFLGDGSVNSYAGGICGSVYSRHDSFISISNCYNTGEISSSPNAHPPRYNSYAGGCASSVRII